MESGIRGLVDVWRWVVSRKGYELENRLVELGALACRVAANLPNSGVGKHISAQLVRCSTSPAANYAEACGSESRKDFIHKLKVCLKELREAVVWFKFVKALEMDGKAPVDGALQEADELIAIFVTSIATARRNQKRGEG